MTDTVVWERQIQWAPCRTTMVQLFSYPTRPCGRPYGSVGGLKYFPQQNQAEMRAQFSTTNLNQESEMALQDGVRLAGSRIRQSGQQCVLFEYGDELYMGPVGEVYQFSPSVDYMDVEAEQLGYERVPDSDEVFKLEKTTQEVSYKYLGEQCGVQEAFQVGREGVPGGQEKEKKKQFDMNAQQYKRYFLNPVGLQQTAKMAKSPRIFIENVVRSHGAVRFSQLAQVLKETPEFILGVLQELCVCVRGVFVLKSKFLCPQKEAAIRDTILYLIGGYIRGTQDAVRLFKQQNDTAALVQEIPDLSAQCKTLSREILQLLTDAPPEVVTKVLEIDDLVEWRGDQWVFAQEDELDLFSQNPIWFAAYCKEMQRAVSELGETLRTLRFAEHIYKRQLRVIDE